MDSLQYLQQYPALYITSAALIGLVVGSFLNVVILRLPVMLHRDWQQQCEDFLDIKPATDSNNHQERFNLATPPSRCSQCGHQIRWWENIPVLSYLVLKGKCSSCHTHISVRYPLIELASGILTALIAWHFGFSLNALLAMILTWSLITLSIIDFDTQLLPDVIVLPILWLGVLVNIPGSFTTLENSVIGAMAGYMSLWSIYQIHYRLTGREGMGFGDFKLLAMLGAWMGWQYLLLIVLLSSLVGAIVGVSLILALGRDRHVPIPFGPYLAAAGWIALIWGEPILKTYLGFTGLSN